MCCGILLLDVAGNGCDCVAVVSGWTADYCAVVVQDQTGFGGLAAEVGGKVGATVVIRGGT